MSFESEKRKLRTIWENSQKNEFEVTKAELLQGKKVTQIQFNESRQTVFSRTRSFNTDWMPMMPVGEDVYGSYTTRAVYMQIESRIYEDWIPFVRVNVAYRRTDGVDALLDANVTSSSSVQIMDTDVENIKKAKWNLAYTYGKLGGTWRDFDMKFYLTIINPWYFTNS